MGATADEAALEREVIGWKAEAARPVAMVPRWEVVSVVERGRESMGKGSARAKERWAALLQTTGRG